MTQKIVNLVWSGLMIWCYVIWPSKVFGQYTLEYSVNGSVVNLTGFLGTPVNVTIPSGVTSIGIGAFGNCASLTSVTIPRTVTSIDANAFYWCTNLISITIPDSVISIGDESFDGCFSLTNAIIGSGVTSIGGQVFANCTSLMSFSVNSSNSADSSVDGALFDENQTTLIRYPSGLNGTYTIPDSVINIGDEAFFQCTKLTSVSIGKSVTSIGGTAFAGCISLTNVAIPNSVTSIGFEAFYKCTGITNVVIGNSLGTLDDFAFEGCTNLAALYFLGNAPTAYSPFSGDHATIYYFSGTTGWTSPFNGLQAVAITPASPTVLGTINNQQLNLQFTGSPYFPYILESATNLSPPINWQPVITNAADPNGNWSFTATNVSSPPQCFYQIRGQ